MRYVITIARGFGSGGKTVGQMLCERLSINYYDRDIIKLASEESGINIALFGRADERVKTGLFKKRALGAQTGDSRLYGEKIIPPESNKFVSDDNLFNIQSKIIRDLAQKESCIIVGRCADYILREYENLVRVFVYASFETCVKNIKEIYLLNKSEAERQIKEIDLARSAYYKYYTGKDWNCAQNYDLSINTSNISFEQCAEIIEDYLKIKGYIEK